MPPPPPYRLAGRSSRPPSYRAGFRISQTTIPGTGMSTGCPSVSPRGYALGPTNPPRIIRAAEPSGLRWGGFAPPLFVTHPDIRTRWRSTVRLRDRFDAPSTLPYHSRFVRSRNPARRCHALVPIHCRRRTTRPVSCYALFQGWLLLSQPPGCHSGPTAFRTEHGLGDLSGWSGLLPSRRPTLAPAVSLRGWAGGIRSLPSVGRL